MTDEETCEACGGNAEEGELRPACPYCGTVQCTLCVNEYGPCCDPEEEIT